MSSRSGSSIANPMSRGAKYAPRLVAVGLVVSLSMLSACDKSSETVATDTLLTRDLTLATASTAPAYTPGLSDTAFSNQSRAPAQREAVSAVVRPTEPSRSASASASAPVPQKVTQKTVTKAPVPASSPEAKPASSATVVAPPASAVGTLSNPATTSAATTSANSAVASGDGARDVSGAGSARHVFGTGTTLVGRTNAVICSLANRPGDRLVATLTSDVVSPDGTRLAAGTPVLIEMSPPASNGDFVFRVKAIQVAGQLVPIEGTVAVTGESSEHQISKGGDKGKVISGAIAGAIIGRVLGGGTKGTIIGAAGGAAAGSAAAARNTVTEKCMPSGATVTVTLTAPLVLAEGVP